MKAKSLMHEILGAMAKTEHDSSRATGPAAAEHELLTLPQLAQRRLVQWCLDRTSASSAVSAGGLPVCTCAFWREGVTKAIIYDIHFLSWDSCLFFHLSTPDWIVSVINSIQFQCLNWAESATASLWVLWVHSRVQFLSTLSICNQQHEPQLNALLVLSPRLFTQVPSGSNLVAPHKNRCLHLLHHFSKTKVPEASCPTAARQDQDWYLPDHLAMPGRWPTVDKCAQAHKRLPGWTQVALSVPSLLFHQPGMRSVPPSPNPKSLRRQQGRKERKERVRIKATSHVN